MKRYFIKAKKPMLVILMASVITICDRKDGISMDLSQFQWKNRLLILFAPDANHPDAKKLHHDIAEQPDEVKARDLLIFEIFGQGASRMDAEALDQQTADSVRDRFGIAKNELTLILVGKDGGVKLKRDGYVKMKDVFELIDSMPMRQNEMRQRKQ